MDGILLRVSSIPVVDGAKLSCKGRICSKWSPWSGGGSACLRKLQFYEYLGKQNLYITAKKNKEGNGVKWINTENECIVAETMRAFYDEDKKGYNDLASIISDDALWKENDCSQTIQEPTEFENPCFMEIIGKNDYELAFSNLFEYIFNYRKDVFVDFAKNVLGVNLSTDFVLKREYKNIDILIYDKENVLVIENKVKSEINGIQKDDTRKSQLSKYYNLVTNGEDDSTGKTIKIPDEDFKKMFKNKDSKFYIFKPNYQQIDLSLFEKGEEYSPIDYKSIYDFYKEKKNEFQSIEQHFDEFLKGLQLHTDDFDRTIELEMKRRLNNRIYKLTTRE